MAVESKAPLQQQQQQLKLNPEAVRRRASSIPGCEELPVSVNNNPSSKNGAACSSLVFLVGCLETDPNRSFSDGENLARVTVYCDTGTIATARVMQPLHQVRHTFRYSVSSLDVVERCLRQPAEMPCIDWKLVGLLDQPSSRSNDHGNTIRTASSQPAARPYQDVSKNLELLEVGSAILKGEREKLVQHLASLEETLIPLRNSLPPHQLQPSMTTTATSTPNTPERREEQTFEAEGAIAVVSTSATNTSIATTNTSTLHLGNSHSSTSTINTTSTTGMEFQFSLAAGPMKHVDQCLSDIRRMNKLVRGVSTNGVGTVFLYGNGGVAYTPNIPRALYHRLSQLRHSKVHANRPAYVSLGTRERYFVAFHDGSFSYKGPKGLDRELRKLTVTPASVAFGSSYDTFLIVYHDGTWKYGGKNLPADLEEQLQRQQPPQRLACVNLGPNGEWFLRAAGGDGRVCWGGVSPELDAAIQELLAADHFVNFLDFGEHGSYFVSYD